MQQVKNGINSNETYLGIEFGSTRIKAVLIGKDHEPIASGSHTWENRFEGGVWTYSLDDIWEGLRHCYTELSADVLAKYGVQLSNVGAIGISAMMHGYMAFDGAGNLLVPFRTWRNTITGEAAKKLTQLFGFNIPQRWSIAHLYQAMLNAEPHVENIRFLTTLSGYIHWQLTGEKVLGIGDASGVLPVSNATRQYDADMVNKFNALTEKYSWKLAGILPAIMVAGENAGVLSIEGAKLLDPTGTLKAGIPMCPPEGDAGTGMVATNSVRPRTGNVSTGTSVFAMVALEKSLSKVYEQIDMVTTPAGDAVAMVHCNNCTGDLDAWVKLLGEAGALLGAEFDTRTLYTKLLNKALTGDADCGGLLSFNYISGEHITGFEEGRPLFVRMPDASFSLANFMRAHLYSACASLNIGMKILINEEGAALDSITGHGGFFKDANVGQRIMSAVMGAPVTVMATAGEGGPWGIAILAAYMMNRQNCSLPDYLSNRVFSGSKAVTVAPDAADITGFKAFMRRYEAGLNTEKTAVESLQSL